jgi:nitrogen regulatory protein PII
MLTRLRRVTVVVGREIEHELAKKLVELGASGYTMIPCWGAGRTGCHSEIPERREQIRVEVITPSHVAEKILDYIACEVSSVRPATACIETVEVLRPDKF